MPYRKIFMSHKNNNFNNFFSLKDEDFLQDILDFNILLSFEKPKKKMSKNLS